MELSFCVYKKKHLSAIRFLEVVRDSATDQFVVLMGLLTYKDTVYETVTNNEAELISFIKLYCKPWNFDVIHFCGIGKSDTS